MAFVRHSTGTAPFRLSLFRVVNCAESCKIQRHDDSLAAGVPFDAELLVGRTGFLLAVALLLKSKVFGVEALHSSLLPGLTGVVPPLQIGHKVHDERGHSLAIPLARMQVMPRHVHRGHRTPELSQEEAIAVDHCRTSLVRQPSIVFVGHPAYAATQQVSVPSTAEGLVDLDRAEERRLGFRGRPRASYTDRKLAKLAAGPA